MQAPWKHGLLWRETESEFMRSPSRNARHGSRPFDPGFTLLELLIAVAVLAMLVVMVAQLVQSGTAVISGSRKHLGADAQAREVFSRFALDLAQMAKRPDLDAIFSDQDSNKKIFFYSEAPGFSSSIANPNTLALVGYRVAANGGLERLGKALSWSEAQSPTFLTFAKASETNLSRTNALPESTLTGSWSGAVGSSPDYDSSDDDYHAIADGVFRFEYCFLKKDGTYSLMRDSAGGFRDVAAVVVSLAVLDGDSRKLAPDTSKLAAALPFTNIPPNDSVPAATVILPAESWQAIINDSAAFAAAGIPQAAASKVRIYQRAFPLNTP